MNYLPTILVAIADDHRLVRSGIIILINSMNFGCHVFIEADDGHELLDKIARSQCQPDVCVIDISMPGMDGYETTLELIKIYPLIRVLALSVHNEEQAVLRMMKNGAKGFISKNCDSETLKKAILTVYDYNIFFSDELLKTCPNLATVPLEELIKRILTDQEIKFLGLCRTEMTYRQIGEQMYLAKRTAENYALKLAEQLGIHGREGLIAYAERMGITPPRK